MLALSDLKFTFCERREGSFASAYLMAFSSGSIATIVLGSFQYFAVVLPLPQPISMMFFLAKDTSSFIDLISTFFGSSRKTFAISSEVDDMNQDPTEQYVYLWIMAKDSEKPEKWCVGRSYDAQRLAGLKQRRIVPNSISLESRKKFVKLFF